LSFAQGESFKEFDIVVKSETIAESNENFFVVFTAIGATIADNTGVGTIVDDDTPPPSNGGGGGGGSTTLPYLTVADVAVTENQDATFTVTLLGSSSKTVTVGYTTSNGSAAAGLDYTTTAGTLSFAPGQQSQTVTVNVVDDKIAEQTETINFSLASASNATILKSLGTATIQDNDVGGVTPVGFLLPRMVLGPPTVTVDATGVARMTITCAKNSPITCSGSVRLETKAKPKFLLGTRKFSAKKGKKVTVRIYLSARAIKLVTAKSPIKVQAVVIVKNSAKKDVRATPGLVTLKASRALVKKVTQVQTTINTAPKPKPKPEPEPKIIIDP
jgi:hypothetical protein